MTILLCDNDSNYHVHDLFSNDLHIVVISALVVT